MMHFMKINTLFHMVNFNVRKKALGFENANKLLRIVDKDILFKLLRIGGAMIGKGCSIESPLIVHNCASYCNLSVGNDVYIGKNCFLDLRARIVIRDNVTISNDCKLITHIDVGQSVLRARYPKSQGEVVINANTYLGAGTMILMGVEIGENCLIAAGSLVRRNIPANSFAAGIPARIIGKTNGKE